MRINEVMASNGATIADDDGDFEDWIELHNFGAEAVDLGGWGLSDDYGRPFRWVFPEAAVLGAGEFLLVWASGKDRTGGGELHTNFSIAGAGEEVILTRPDGDRVDELPPTEIPRDVSVGRVEGGGDTWFFFAEPTPGAANDTEAFQGVTEPPVFSHEAGFYEDGFILSLHAAAGAEILYTLDGSVPDADAVGGQTWHFKNEYPRPAGETELGPLLEASSQTLVYDAPFAIDDRTAEPEKLAAINTRFTVEAVAPLAPVLKGTVVRARAVREGYLPSPTVTRTFFVHPGMEARYGVPLAVISIAAEPSGLFAYEPGIYVPGQIADQWRLDNPSASWNPIQPANYHGRGPDWEREGHIEIFSADGGSEIARDIGLRIHGGWSRGNRVKSLRLYARSRHGDDTIRYPIFPGLEKQGIPGEPMTEFRRLILRNSGGFNDWEFTYLRDAFMQDLVAHLPLEAQAYRPAVHFLNGEYWGLINIRERLDAHYLAAHFGLPAEDIAILTTVLQGPLEVDTGSEDDLAHFLDVVEFAEGADLADPAHRQWVEERVDTANLALYYAVQVCLNNKDWPDNNNDLWRRRTDEFIATENPGFDGRWRWLLYDLDFGFGGWNFPRTNRPLARVVHLEQGSYRRSSVVSNPVNRLFRELVLGNEAFRHEFLNTLADLLNSAFVPERVLARLDAFESTIAPYRAEHNDRWDTHLRPDPKMVVHANESPGLRRAEAVEVFGLGGVRELTVAEPAGEGLVRVNSLLIDGDLAGISDPAQPYPWTGTYFKGVPVSVEAVPSEGHRLLGWRLAGSSDSGTQSDPPPLDSTEPVLSLDPAEGWTVEAVFEPIPERELPVVLHAWDFEDADDFLSASYTLGGAALSVVPGPDTGVVRNHPAQGFSSAHLRVNEPLGASLEFSLPTTGYADVTMRFLTRRSGQGAGEQTLSYTTGDGQWHALATYEVFNDLPQERVASFASADGIDDNAQFAVRITFAEGEGGTAGNNRFDDVQLTGTALPDTNLPPRANEETVPPLIELSAGGAPFVFDPGAWFTDPDGDALTFAAQSTDTGVATVEPTDDFLLVSGASAGETVLTVTASDEQNPEAVAEVRVLVYPAPFPVAEDEFHFGYWSADNPAGAFPPHMIFLQSEVTDPGLTADLTFAYRIPPEDAARPADTAFPYAAESRSRINGLGEDGIALINTGRGRDLGVALLALDTTGAESVYVGWTAQTLLPNDRIYGIRLQYRAGLSGPWSDLLLNGLPVEYLRSESTEDPVRIGPVRLPAELENQPLVQLQWRYFHIAGDSGPRARLRLDDITVTSGPPPAGPTPFAAWIADPAWGVPADQQGPLDAPAGDDVPNLLKFAQGLPPMMPATGGPRVDVDDSGDGPCLTFTYRQRAGGSGEPGVDYTADGLRFTVETSDALHEDSWGTEAAQIELVGPPVPNDDGTETVTVRVALPDSSGQPRFLRLRVSEAL